jgi:hypothetical protein
VANAIQSNFSIKLALNGTLTCDEPNVKLNVTGPANTTATLAPTACAAGVHVFTIDTSSPGANYLVAYSTATDYAIPPATCAFQSTAGQVRAYPDVNFLLVVAAGLAAVFLSRARRRASGKNH